MNAKHATKKKAITDKKQPKNRNCSVRLDETTANRLQELADASGLSVTSYIRACLTVAVEEKAAFNVLETYERK